MKKFLPKTSGNPKGFTLIELLVVIAIIAILATIGATIFSGVQQRARDGRRQADVLAIAKAMEAQKPSGNTVYASSTTPPPISGTWFAGGIVPAEPAGYVPQYSIAYVNASGYVVNKPTSWLTTSATPGAPTTTPAGGTITVVGPVAAGIPSAGSIYAFQVCALLEGGIAPNIFCVPNQQ